MALSQEDKDEMFGMLDGWLGQAANWLQANNTTPPTKDGPPAPPKKETDPPADPPADPPKKTHRTSKSWFGERA